MCLSLSEPSSVYLLIYFWIDRFLAKTLFPRAPHITTKEKVGAEGEGLFVGSLFLHHFPENIYPPLLALLPRGAGSQLMWS